MFKNKKYFLVSYCVFLAVLSVWSVSFAHQDSWENASSPTAWHEGYTLILISNTDIPSANQARDYVISRGGRIALLSPPHIMLGWIPSELSAELIGKYGIELVTQVPVDLKNLKYQDDRTLAMASFFNSVSFGSLAKEIGASPAVKGEPLINDALEHPIINHNDYLKNLENLGIAPSLGNSDSMTGTVAVALFFVESNGSIDPDTYTWSATDQQNTINRASNGLSWWASQAPLYGESVTFTVNFYSSTSSVTQQGYEPILHASSNDGLWINPIMANLGFASGTKFERVTAFNTWLKGEVGTNWAYSVFIGYNPSPAADTFTDGYFAYAYMGGPYSQMLFRNNGWGEENFGLVLTHETGHIFWACDEYFQSGYGGCTYCGPCAPNGPRPDINNGNCEYCNPNSVPCMMRDNDYALCSFTILQIGWSSSCSAPAGFSYISPSDGASNQANHLILDWGDSQFVSSYDIYFGTTNPPPLLINKTSSNHDPGVLSNGTTYYWKIVAKNICGTFSGPVWSFTTITAPNLFVTPAGGLTFKGNAGGPFSPSSKSYTLQNTGGSSINWTASKTQTWTTLSSTSGTLAAGASTTVTVSINSDANSLAAGSYSDTVSFTNTTNGSGNTTRPVSLTITGPPSASITVTSPNGEENWAAGTTQTINWTYTGNPGSYVKIELLKGGKLILTIYNSRSIGTAGSGSYSWPIRSTLAGGSDYQVKVTSTTNSGYTDTSDGNFTITGPPPPSITVTTPNGRENWAAGTTQTINWSYSGSPGSAVKIELFKGGVLNRTIIGSRSIGSGGTGSYPWVIPSTQTAGGDYQVKVTSTTNSAYTDASDANFTITGPPPPLITVTTPNGGETWAAGTTQTVTWTYVGSPGSYVKIELFKGGVLNRIISSSSSIGTDGSGSYSWPIPSTQAGGSDYQVRVTSTTNSAYTDASDENFTITGPTPPSIAVTSPKGGENWAAGSTQTIQWTYTGNPGSYVKIELLKGGKLILTIYNSRSIGTGGSGSYAWPIRSTLAGGSDYQVRVTSTTNSAYTDTSDGFFMITP